MHHVDLIVGKHDIEEIRKGGNQTRPQGVGKIRDLGDYPVDGEVGRGQAVVLPHSLKIVARAELTLPKPSAGDANGGEQGGGMGFFPLPFFVGAMAIGRGGRFEIGLKTEAGVREEEGQRALEQQKGERCVRL